MRKKAQQTTASIRVARPYRRRLQAGESSFWATPRILSLVPGGSRAYLWIGGDPGPCYGTLSGPKVLRAFARAILREVGDDGRVTWRSDEGVRARAALTAAEKLGA